MMRFTGLRQRTVKVVVSYINACIGNGINPDNDKTFFSEVLLQYMFGMAEITSAIKSKYDSPISLYSSEKMIELIEMINEDIEKNKAHLCEKKPLLRILSAASDNQQIESE